MSSPQDKDINFSFLSILSTNTDTKESVDKFDYSSIEISDLRRSQLKLVIIGEGAVGKTTLRLNYMGESTDGLYLATLGADFSVKYIKLNQDYSIMLQIWDIAGQSRFKDVVRGYFDGANGALVVYDLTRVETFDAIKYWLDKLFSVVGPVPFVVLGNKRDIAPPAIDKFKKEADQMINAIAEHCQKEYGFKVHHLLTSAFTGENVEDAFRILTTEIQKQFV